MADALDADSFVFGLKTLYRRWRARHRPISESQWRRALRSCPYAKALPLADRQRLRELTTLFLCIKTFEPVDPIRINEGMRLTIALKACVPILNLGLEYYIGWSGIVLYPGDFRVREHHDDDAGVVHEEMVDLCGQALTQGPIVLSWQSIRSELRSKRPQDLVIHECAHKLDTLNGEADGFPSLHPDMQPKAWEQAFRAAYERLAQDVRRSRPTRLDPYAASDLAEFFAVASETFFTAPRILWQDFPAVYQQLNTFYRQDPYARFVRRKKR